MQLRLPGRILALDGPPAMVGIVNVTPDSFYDRGISATAEAAVERAADMLAAGAAVVDVGGMTAQPGAELSEDEEASRVAPVIERLLRREPAAVISVDTYRAGVADAALAAGAQMVNDHTGLSDDRMAEVVARHDAGLVVTYLGLRPKERQERRYAVSPEEIFASLDERAGSAAAAGVRHDAIVLDPGLGFGKDTDTDLETLRALPALLDRGRPVLLACSHKEVTAEPLGLPESALEGTAAVVAVAAHLGVHLLRVHDLPFMAHVARMGWLTSARSRR